MCIQWSLVGGLDCSWQSLRNCRRHDLPQACRGGLRRETEDSVRVEGERTWTNVGSGGRTGVLLLVRRVGPCPWRIIEAGLGPIWSLGSAFKPTPNAIDFTLVGASMGYAFEKEISFRRRESALRRLSRASGWPEKAYRWHCQLLRNYAKNRYKLRLRVQAGQLHEAYRLQDHILNSLAAAVSVTIDNVVPRGKSKPIEPLSPADLEKKARAIRPTRRILGLAVALKKPKADGSYRIVLSPDWKVRRAQDLVAEVLECWSLTSSFDFNTIGRGHSAAVQEVKRQIIEDGARHFVQFDCKNHFSSVKPPHLKGMPIPRQVLMHTAFYNRSVILLHPSLDEVEVKTARLGLPAGARLSGTLAATLLGREIRNLCGAMGKPVMFVDDVIIGGCDPAGAKDLAEALEDWFSQLPGGPLDLKLIRVTDVCDGFDFLGYWIRLVPDHELGQKIVLKPSHVAKSKFKRRLFKRLDKVGKGASHEALLFNAAKYQENWRAAFVLWEPTNDELTNLTEEVHCWVFDWLNGDTKKFPIGKGFQTSKAF